MEGIQPMARLKMSTIALIGCVAVTLAFMSLAEAKKPVKPPGGGGGGGGDSAPYRLVDLGGFVGGDHVQAEALDVNNPDDAGVMQVVGYSFRPIPGLRVADAAVWDVTDDGQILELTNIAPGPLENTGGRRVNELGYVLVADLLWVPNAGYVTLTGLGGGDGIPELMDDLGGVYGVAFDVDGIEHAVAWQVSPDGHVSAAVDLDVFFWNDVNNNGVFAGWVVPAREAAIAWFDEQGSLQIEILGKLHPDGYAYALCINDNGMVAGETDDRLGLHEGFVWTLETGMVSIGSLDGRGCDVRDINNQGQIVGWSWSNGRFGQVAFLWQNGEMFDLNEITDGGGGKNWIQIASGINDVGHIVGLLHITKPTSRNHGTLLVPNVN
jgi:probable HAF family extracellular repeat protein